MAMWREISVDLRDKIEKGELVEGDRIPTEEQLASQYCVSRQTVNKALSELKQEGIVSRQRRWGTVVTASRKPKTGLVALMFDYTNDFPQRELVRGIQEGLGDELRIIFCDARGDVATEAENINLMRSQADGIICYPLSDTQNTPLLKQIVQSRMPLVLLDRLPDGLSADVVNSDNYAASYELMKGLIKAGHQKIAFISGDNEYVSTVRARHQAYIDALSEIGEYDATYERWFSKDLETKSARLLQTVSDALFALSHREEPPTAIFSVQDVYAAAILEAMEQLNIESESLHIATYNDWPAMMLRRTSEMSLVIQPSFEIGLFAARRLIERLANPGLPTQTTSIPSRVILTAKMPLEAIVGLESTKEGNYE